MSKILLLEPDRLLANDYIKALELANHSVIWQSDAQSAIHSIDKQIPDVILLELQIRNHNGIEFLHEIRSYTEWQEIPVILLSMVPKQMLALSPSIFKRLGIVDYLYKPQTKLKHLIYSVEKTLQISTGNLRESNRY